MYPRPIRTRPAVPRLLYAIALPISLIVWLLPMIAVMLTAMRPLGDVLAGNMFGWPSRFQLLENFRTVFEESPFLPFLWNTIKLTVPCAVLTVFLATLAAYALTSYRSRWSLPLLLLFIAGNFIPFQILFFPVRTVALATGLHDTTTGLVLFHAGFQVGFCTFFMRNFIRELPFELIETARIEGVSERKIFMYVVLPLMRPAIAALLLLVFTFVWNDYFWATILTQSNDSRPIVAAIEALNGQFVSRHHLTSAASLIAALPPVILFFLAQKYFIAGLTFGASKG